MKAAGATIAEPALDVEERLRTLELKEAREAATPIDGVDGPTGSALAWHSIFGGTGRQRRATGQQGDGGLQLQAAILAG